jgi:hypothetical protein
LEPTPWELYWCDEFRNLGFRRLWNRIKHSSYTIKARWTASGQTAIQERQVNIQAGWAVTVDFRANIENAPPVLP